MDQRQISLILMIAVVGFAVYRRVRRNIGRQPYQPNRMRVRMVIFGVIGAIALLFSFRNIDVGGAMIAGLIGGAALGIFGVRHTRFETTPKGQFYTPHTYIGLFVTLLLLGRLAYRFFIVLPTMQAAAQIDANPYASFQKSPLTMAIFGVVIGYYIAYYAAVIREMSKEVLAAPAQTGAQPPSAD